MGNSLMEVLGRGEIALGSAAADLVGEEVVDERGFDLRRPAELPRRLRLTTRDSLLSSLSGLSSNWWLPLLGSIRKSLHPPIAPEPRQVWSRLLNSSSLRSTVVSTLRVAVHEVDLKVARPQQTNSSIIDSFLEDACHRSDFRQLSSFPQASVPAILDSRVNSLASRSHLGRSLVGGMEFWMFSAKCC
ncbi:unnamed protein product [Linum tenue]|uniref:Uncharacterized protein n=1 Tax=Linum tenue TaxID=586396 RepID=A0AAV0RT72_9ROSI|nr:unnamed protein product [Linum tenue]